jgi:hypothetical protein
MIARGHMPIAMNSSNISAPEIQNASECWLIKGVMDITAKT